MASMSKQLQDTCPQDAARCAQHTKCPGHRYRTSVSGQGGHRSPAERKALALEQLRAPRCPCWEAGTSSAAHLAPRYKALSCTLQLTCSTQSCNCHSTEPHTAPLQGMTLCSVSVSLPPHLQLVCHQQQLLLRLIFLPGISGERALDQQLSSRDTLSRAWAGEKNRILCSQLLKSQFVTGKSICSLLNC